VRKHLASNAAAPPAFVRRPNRPIISSRRVRSKRLDSDNRVSGKTGTIQSRHPRVRTTRVGPDARKAPDLVQRDFTASAPYRLWVADVGKPKPTRALTSPISTSIGHTKPRPVRKDRKIAIGETNGTRRAIRSSVSFFHLKSVMPVRCAPAVPEVKTRDGR
jgi:hypothetical protein